MRGLLMIWSDPSWDEPIISLVREVKLIESWVEQELPTGSYVKRERDAVIVHSDGSKEQVRIWDSQGVTVILDDGRPFATRGVEEAELHDWMSQ